MFRHIFGFELRQQFGNPVFWVIASVFALLAFGAASSDAVQVGGAIGNINRNAPYVIVQLISAFTLLTMLLAVIFIGGAALRDFDNRTAELFFATPMKKRDYLLGRFGGGFVIALIIMLAVAAGILAGGFMPWIDPERLGPTSAVPYLWALTVIILPNLFFIGALLFCLAVATRSMLVTYIGVIAFIVLNTVTGVLTADLDARWIGALLDPYGAAAMEASTRYWSISERNSQLPPLDGLLLANRTLWIGIGALLMWASYRLFRTDREGWTWRRRKSGAVGGTSTAGATATIVVPKAQLQTGFGAQLRQFFHQAKFDAKGVLRGVPLLVMLLFGLMILIVNLIFGDQMYGTTRYATTATMTSMIAGSYALFLIIIVVFYAGELVFRERTARIAEVTDAYPNADWIPLASKLVALVLVVIAFYATGIVATVINQLIRGGVSVEPGLYLSRMLLDISGFVLMGVLALFLQVLTNNKFIGYLLMLVYLVLRGVMGFLDLDDRLYNIFGASPTPYSDMNGYGHFLVGWTWFRVYWGAFAALLFIAALLFWVRGNRSTFPERLREARRRFTLGPIIASVTALAVFIGSGIFIFHNTHRLNEYVPSDVQLDRRAEYEQKYRQYKDIPQPRITAMKVDVDLYPETLRAKIRGHYRLVNRHDVPIQDLHIFAMAGFKQSKIALELPEHHVEHFDDTLNHAIYRLAKPLAPGAEMDLRFTMELGQNGFPNGMSQTQIVHNGSFFNSGLFPSFGYNENVQITDRNERRKRDLGEVPRMASIDDEAARANTYISNDADWLHFETTVSTAPDQIALAPGYLQREWEENGRRYFHYTMDVPMLNFAAWLSARWDVARGDWNGMPIEVYHDPKHAWNVQRMIEAAQKSFDYYNTHFTPYQHKQLRILEFPGYAGFAQAFANTVPYSEDIGFVADLRNQEKIDYVFYVTAHEVAHQWWAHQVIGANVQGSTMLSESLSQYSALMVMEKEYGAHRMRKFLKYELDRYLMSRSSELREELPLALVENQQYIHYQKGSLVFYALRDYIGEETLNAVLKRFLQDKGYQNPPYTTSREFLSYLREGTDPAFHPLIEDLFEKIVFFDNRAVEATAVKRDDGKYAVTLKLHAAKFEADGKGKETDATLRDAIDVGIFARPKGGKEDDETVLYLAKHQFSGTETTLEIVVDGEPYDAGIDPYNKLIDRDSNDNRRRVTVK
ncbi:M1 family aminopeptidase [Xanthomonadaceae bacterium XH05]|nr:M1 family aminopeptidase [Xanthomonadaceae bacterium XH05]